MKPHVYAYPNDTFRGWVATYQGQTMQSVHCTEVRKNRLKALEDAKKLLKELRQK